MTEKQGRLEITLSALSYFELRESRITSEVLTSGVENFLDHHHSRPPILYQATLSDNSGHFMSYIRELLAIEITRHLSDDTQTKEVHVKADTSFLMPDEDFSKRNILPRIRHILNMYGLVHNAPVTYEGFH